MEQQQVDILKIITSPRRLLAVMKGLDVDQVNAIKDVANNAAAEYMALNEARLAKEAERREKVANFRKQMEQEGITLVDLVEDAPSSTGKRSAGSRAPVEPKYQFEDETGNAGTWTGRGRMPTALKAKLDAGAKLDDFLINKG